MKNKVLEEKIDAITKCVDVKPKRVHAKEWLNQNYCEVQTFDSFMSKKTITACDYTAVCKYDYIEGIIMILKKMFPIELDINTKIWILDLNKFLDLLTVEGKMLLVGIPPEDNELGSAKLISRRRSIIGSNVGGIAETQEMLDYCAEHNILSDVEMIQMKDINKAYTRISNSDVKYRFVIDMASM